MENTVYKEELTRSMNYLSTKNDTIFIGQQIVYPGNPMSVTIEEVPKEKMIETPVFEDIQLGMSIGLTLTGMCAISFYPRWDFLICASNQLVTHLDKFKDMTNKEAHVIIRVGRGSDTPLDPGHQHRADYSDNFKELLNNVEVINFHSHENIYETYVSAYENKKPIILVEYPEKYYG